MNTFSEGQEQTKRIFKKKNENVVWQQSNREFGEAQLAALLMVTSDI